jgi:streptogramin lyase
MVKEIVLAHFPWRRILSSLLGVGLFFGCLTYMGAIYAQTTPLLTPTFRAYNQMNGLPQLQVRGFFQDSRGVLWAGTKNGAAYFDGEEFVALKEMTKELGPSVHRFAEDANGVIWMGCTLGIASFDGREIQCYPFPEGLRGVSSMVIDTEGTLWFTADNNLYTFSEGIFKEQSEAVVGIRDSIRHLAHDYRTGRFLMGGLGKLYEFLPEEDTVEVLWEFGADESVNVYSHYGTELIIGVSGPGSRSQFYEFDFERGPHLFLKLSTVDQKIIDFFPPRGDVFIKVDHFFLLYGAAGDSEYRKISLDGYPIVRPFRDRGGNIWFATEAGVVQYFGNLFQQASREVDNSWLAIQDQTGDWWFGSYYWGVKKYEKGAFKSFALPTPKRRKEAVYFGPSMDQTGTIYLPHGEGLVRINNGAMDLVLTGTSIFSFYDNASGQVFSGVKEGVKILHPDGTQSYLGPDDGLKVPNYVVSIEKERDSVFWLGGFFGLSRWDQSTGEIINYEPLSDSFPSSGIISMHQDPWGTLWIGSRTGLLTYNPNTGKIERVSDELGDDVVSFVGTLDSTYLLYAQPEGIFVMDLTHFRETGEIRQRAYNASNGFIGFEPNQNGLTLDQEGNAWIVTGDKVLRMDPNYIELEAPQLTAYVKSYNNKSLPFAYNKNTIELDHNQRNVTLQLGAIGFERPRKVEYSYRLIERDTVWSEWSKSEQVFLPDLRSGTYLLEIRAKGPGMKASLAPITAIPLMVDLAVWREPHFAQMILVAASLLALLLVLFFGYLIRRERRKLATNDRKMRLLQVQTLQAQMNPHFVFNVLGSLQNLILNNDKEIANTYLVKLSRLIRSYLNSSIKSDYSKGFSADNEITLKEEIELLTMYIEFEKLQFQDRFDYEIKVDENLIPENRTLPPMLLQPYVENAIKHGLLYKSGQGFLSVRFADNPDNEGMVIVVEDDGVGIDKAKEIQRKSVRRFKSEGRKLVKERLEVLKEIGYQIEDETRSGEWGTRVILKIG